MDGDTLHCSFKLFYLNGTNNFACLYHKHEYYELLFILNGTLDSISELGVHHCGRSSLLLIPPGAMHRHCITDTSSRYERYVLFWKPDFLADSPGFDEIVSDIVNRGGRVDMTEREMSRFKEDFKRLHDDPTEMHARLMIPLICYGIRKLDTIRKPEKPGQRGYISDVMQYICEHYREKLVASELAERFNVSRTKLMCDFHEIVSKTLNEYITNERLVHALQYLKEGRHVSEAAELSGFMSERNFRQCFVKRFGTPPLKYIRSMEDLNDPADI